MKTLLIKAAGLTDQGKVRSNNEDALWVDEERGLLIVADGMGGHQAGEVASGLAIESIPGTLNELGRTGATEQVIDENLSAETNRLGISMRVANQTIFETGKRYPQSHGMGTTCTAALITNNRLSVAHVGDSRCYLIRRGHMEQLTQDHSLVMEQVRQGLLSKDDEAVQAAQNILTRSLGTEPTVKIDLDEHPLLPGDVVLLCSDGLGKEINDDEILRIAEETPEPGVLVKRLVEAANSAGGRDNITVAVARLDKAGLGETIKSFFKAPR